MHAAEDTRGFLVCLHDVTPAFERETAHMLRDLAPLIDRRVSAGVVPDWHGKWPLTAHPDFCEFVRAQTSEVLVHGHRHTRTHGVGLVSLLAERSDEMNGVRAQDASQFLIQAKQKLTRTFGGAIRGFLPPAWQRGHANDEAFRDAGLEYVLGYFRLESFSQQHIPLSTFSWDCGWWSALGLVGHTFGELQHAIGRGTPSLAIHPRDINRGYWPLVLRTVERLLKAGYTPTTPGRLIGTTELRQADVQIAV